MKSIRLLCAAITVSLVPHAAFAQLIIWNFNELGIGSLQSGNFLIPLWGSIATEPISGVATLKYPLAAPGTVTAGDLVIREPGSLAISDILRFSSEPGGAVYVFSDISDGADSLADVVDLTTLALQANLVYVDETGPEDGPNGFNWTPVSGQPGFVAGQESYNFISDVSVPEPQSSWIVPAIAAVAAIAWRRRERVTLHL